MVRRTPIVLTLAAAALAAGCGCDCDDDGPGPGDTTPPTIVATVPVDGATDVDLFQRVEVTFSEPMDPTTINDTTIVVAERTARSYVDYDAATRTAHVLPETLYVPEAQYTIVVTDDVTDEAGNALVRPDTFGFETGTFDCDHLADYLEPNDGVVEASPIDLDVVYRMLTLCEDDQDVFEFALTEPAKIAVRWHYRRADTLSTYFDITRTDGNTYGIFNHIATAGDWRMFYFTLLPGTYYLGMWSPALDSYVLYDLDLTTEEPCAEDPYEDNDFRVEAHPIEPGLMEGLRGCIYDSDLFRLDLEAGRDVTVTVTSTSPGEPNRLVALYPAEGPAIASETGTDNPLTIQGTTVQSGAHYVQITFYENDVVYDLDVAVAR